MSDYIIKLAETEDERNGRGYVHYRSWQETYDGLIDPNYLATVTLEKCTSIANRFPDNVLVAKDGDRVVGFAAYGSYRDNTLPDHGEIYALYVLREYQGRGLGYRLMCAAMKNLSKYPSVALWVLKGNEKAIRFYQKYGYIFDGMEETVLLGTPNTELRMIYQQEDECPAGIIF